jgi:integrase
MNVIVLPTARKRVRLHPRAKASANRASLTEDKVAALPGKRKDYYVWDAGGRGSVPGLHVHVQPTGTKTYRYSFRFPRAKNAISYKLGRWPGMSLDQAREKASVAAKLVAKGIDPRSVDPANSDSFDAVVRMWHKREQVQRLQNVSADDTLHFVQRIFADLKPRPVADIKRYEISNILSKLVESGRGPSANRAHSHIKSFFNWCVEEELVQFNPVRRRSPAPEPKPRSRPWFTGKAADPVIKGLWDYASRVGSDEGKFIKLALITGKRRNAVARMTWEQIDDSWYWTPVKGSKSKRNTPIPLPKLAQRILGKRGQGSVFDLPATAFEKVNRRLKKAVEPTFFIHGIRHVMATKLDELKIAPHISRMVLDHKAAGDAHAGYVHVDWTPEMLEALEGWAAYIEAIVVPIGARILR